MTAPDAPVRAPSLADIRAARERIFREGGSGALRTPLVRLHVEDAPAEIHLKLENLQPIGSFKLRGAASAMELIPREAVQQGVLTASAGNMAQGVAWCARRLGVPCTVIVPEQAPEAKLRAITRLGGRFVKEPFARWWQVLVDHGHPRERGTFIHPVSNEHVIAGNGTVGLEILEDLPDVDTILVPFGGGGLSSGIASAVRALRPQVRVIACEVGTAAPLEASLAAGCPQSIDYVPSFVDGIGAGGVLPEMWPLVSDLLAGSVTSSVPETAHAVKLLVERAHVVAEGAGAVAVAAALAGRGGGGKVACIVSGGNLDLAKLSLILGGGVP